MKKWGGVKTVFYIFFLFYCFLLVSLIMFKRIPFSVMVPENNMPECTLNLIPFAIIRTELELYGVRALLNPFGNLLGNVVLFVPLGLYLPLLLKKPRLLLCLLWAGAVSALLELTQLVSGLGVCDIDDVLLNVTGAVVGFGLYRLLLQLCKNSTQTVFQVVAAASSVVGVLVLTLMVIPNLL